MPRVTVSVPRPLVLEADRRARDLRVSRSQVFARALELFLRQQPHREVTRRLDAVYGSAGGAAPDQGWLDAGVEVLRRVDY